MSLNTNIRPLVDSLGARPNTTSHSFWMMEDLFELGGTVGDRNERKLEQFVEPTPLVTDFIEIGLLALVFFIGTPLNLIVLFKLVAEYRKRTTNMLQRDLGTSLTLMKAHLTVCNLLVLLLFCPLKIVWLATYEWMAGELLCRWTHFLWLFAFCASSNVVAVIAVDRMRLIHRFGRAQRGQAVVTNVAHNCVLFAKIMLGVAWAIAAACSIPQHFVWTTVTIRVTSDTTWSQCTTIWQKQSACDQFECIDEKNRTIYTPIVSRLSYHMFHMVTVFWLPFALVFFSYVYIVLELLHYFCFPYTVVHNVPFAKHTDSIASAEFALTPLPPNPSTIDRSNSGERISISRINHLSMSQLNIVTRICPIERGSSAETTLLSETSSLEKVKMQPLWRSQMRSRMFRTSASIVGCYVLCWLPYNVLAVGVEISREWEERISEHAEWIKWFVLLNALLNPFLYGRPKDGCF